MKMICKLVLAAAVFLCGCHSEKVESARSWKMLSDDAGGRMLNYVADFVKISPRDAGTPGAARASRWITQELIRLGCKPVVDCWTESTVAGKKAFCNVYVDFPGSSGQTIIVLSHYDTKAGIPNFQGANDGGSSVGVLLGLIEHFIETKPTLRDTIRFAFVDGEEAYGPSYRDDDGLHGSTHLAAQYEQATKTTPPELLCAIVVDMVGDKDLKISIPRNVSPWLGLLALRIANERSKNQYPLVHLGESAMLDDHVPFLNYGFSAIDLIDFEYGSKARKHEYWHSPEDSIDKLSARSLHQTANLVLAMLVRINDKDDIVPAGLRPTQTNTKR